MSEGGVTQKEARLASILFYGLLGGIAGAANCCCWPGSFLAAWIGTKRAVARGFVEPGDGLSFGFGVGLVMALVMSSLGTAIALSGFDGPEAAEAFAALPAEFPMWLLAGVIAVMLGAVGLGSGLMGGLFASSARQLPETPTPATTASRPPVPVPGSMGSAEVSAGSVEDEAPPPAANSTAADVEDEAPPSIDPADFVTAETVPRDDPPRLPSAIHDVADPERTVSLDPDRPTAAEELREWEGEQSSLEDEETEGDL